MPSQNVPFRWRVVNREDGEPYRFPDEPSAQLRGKWDVPAVYRWCIAPPYDPAMYFVGETASLGRRLEQYFRPGPAEAGHQRLASLLRDERAAGATIRLEVLELDELDLPGLTVLRSDLELACARRLVVGLIELMHRKSGDAVVNDL